MLILSICLEIHTDIHKNEEEISMQQTYKLVQQLFKFVYCYLYKRKYVNFLTL